MNGFLFLSTAFRQDLQDFQDYFNYFHFPEESEKTPTNLVNPV